MSDKMREEFEAWYKGIGSLVCREDDGNYSFQHTRYAWQAWQASRAAMAKEVNKVGAEDVASLQRYGLVGYCDQIGNYCGDEVAPDDEGEYILLSDALSLFAKP